jgi:hypothetical protein
VVHLARNEERSLRKIKQIGRIDVMVDWKKLSRNMDVRVKAEEIKKLIDEMFDEEKFTDEEKQRAWGVILNEVFDRDDADEKMSVAPMSYNEARRWYHNHILTFGKHKDKKIEDVPFEYLSWLAWQPDFRRDLNRFLASEFVKTQQYLKGSKSVEEDSD